MTDDANIDDSATGKRDTGPPMGPDTAEQSLQRRQDVRVPIRIPVTLRIAGRPSAGGRTRDLSAAGVGLATRLPIEVDESGTITIHFPNWEFTKDVSVRFVKPILAGRQIGAQFVDLTADERERLTREVFAVQRTMLQRDLRR